VSKIKGISCLYDTINKIDFKNIQLSAIKRVPKTKEKTMLNITGVDHLNLNVKSLSESQKYYSELFGFELREEGTSASSGAPYVILGLKNKIYLCLYENESADKETRFLNHLGFHVENFDEVLKELEARNLPYLYGGHVQYQNSRSVYTEDPNGIEIELSEVFGGGLN
jgi:lactoylglutathione lyase